MAMTAAASRYARALADAVGDVAHGTEHNVESQIRDFAAMVHESADLHNVLASPAVPTVKKKSLIEALGAKMGLTKLVRNFLFVLIDHKRIGLLQEILPLYLAEMDDREGMVGAQISSPMEIEPAARIQIETALGHKTGKKIRATYSVDASLIGGVVARIGSTVYDGSVREHLRDLRKRLAAQA